MIPWFHDAQTVPENAIIKYLLLNDECEHVSYGRYSSFVCLFYGAGKVANLLHAFSIIKTKMVKINKNMICMKPCLASSNSNKTRRGYLTLYE